MGAKDIQNAIGPIINRNNVDKPFHIWSRKCSTQSDLGLKRAAPVQEPLRFAERAEIIRRNHCPRNRLVHNPGNYENKRN